MNNKGFSMMYVFLIMLLLFTLISVVWKYGTIDIQLSRAVSDKTKAYYTAEAGIYYAGSIIYEASKSEVEPVSSINVDNPFEEYNTQHGFTISIVKEGISYRVQSEGRYKNTLQKTEALITISEDDILYNEMKKIS